MKNITNRKTINTTMLAIIIGFILLSILIYQTVRVVYPYVEMNEDNSSCEVMDSVNVLKCHGADNIGTISSDANVRLDSITHWRNNSNQLQQNPNIFNVSFDYLKDICYPFPNNNEEIFGDRKSVV